MEDERIKKRSVNGIKRPVAKPRIRWGGVFRRE
jgi:hypothetical protein